MSEYEYKKVEGMTVGQVVQQMSEGVVFYRHKYGNEVVIKTSVAGIHIKSDFVEMDLGSLRMELNDGHIYTRTEKPWWEGCEGMPVIVSNNKIDWHTDIFKDYNGDYQDCYGCLGGRFDYMRPLTTTERDAIKVREL